MLYRILIISAVVGIIVISTIIGMIGGFMVYDQILFKCVDTCSQECEKGVINKLEEKYDEQTIPLEKQTPTLNRY